MFVEAPLLVVLPSIALICVAVVLLISFCGLCGERKPDYERLPLYNDLEMRYEKKKPDEEKVQQDAVLAARFYLRGKTYNFVEPLEHIGRRKQKHFFLVKSADGQQMVMSMTQCEDAVERFSAIQLVTGVRSHFVEPAVDADYVEDKKMFVCFRPVHAKGSLRDIIHESKWKAPYERKYGRRGEALSEVRCATWGRHILEGMAYLRVKGWPAGNVHCGNIMVENNVCRITDFELKLANCRPEPSVWQLIRSDQFRLVDPDVVSFACILFEMATGQMVDPAVDSVTRPAPGLVAPSIMRVLDAIFYSRHASQAAPSLEQLLSMEPFASAQMPDLAPLPRLKASKKAKELLREARRRSQVGGAEVRKPPRPAPRNPVYGDTPLTTASYVAAPKNATSPRPQPTSTAAPAPAPAPAKAPAPAPAPAAPKAPSAPPKASSGPAAPPPPPAAPSGGGAPPPPPPPAPGAPPPPPPPVAVARPAAGRGALLDSIEGFKKGGLKKTVTVDKSKPLLSTK